MTTAGRRRLQKEALLQDILKDRLAGELSRPAGQVIEMSQEEFNAYCAQQAGAVQWHTFTDDSNPQ